MKEIGFDVGGATSSFLGYKMNQRPFTIEAFNYLFIHAEQEGRPFKRIIELGTRKGAFTLFLGMYGYIKSCTIYTYDIENFVPPGIKLLFNDYAFDIAFWNGDIFKDSCMSNFLREHIQEDGRTLLLCDNGDKIREFKTFAPLLKSGDVIMAHDYVETQERFEKEFKKEKWGYCEVTYQDIAEDCEKHNLQPHLQEIFDDVVWLCRIKDK
jgi:hypothetical protein